MNQPNKLYITLIQITPKNLKPMGNTSSEEAPPHCIGIRGGKRSPFVASVLRPIQLLAEQESLYKGLYRFIGLYKDLYRGIYRALWGFIKGFIWIYKGLYRAFKVLYRGL